MEIIRHFEVYISAQKATGMHFVIFGGALLLAAIIFHFSQLNPIAQGMRNGFFVISVLLLASGIGFIVNQNKLLQTKTETYQSNELEFRQQEVDRMQQVHKSVPNIITGLGIAIAVLTLAVTFFIHQPFWKGVCFSVLIYFFGLFILESVSFLSVKIYLASLFNH